MISKQLLTLNQDEFGLNLMAEMLVNSWTFQLLNHFSFVLDWYSFYTTATGNINHENYYGLIFIVNIFSSLPCILIDIQHLTLSFYTIHNITHTLLYKRLARLNSIWLLSQTVKKLKYFES